MGKKIAINDLLDTQLLVNTTIESSDGAIFRAHLEILAAVSPFFQKFLTCPSTVVRVPGVSKDTLSEIIKFIYTHSCDFNEETVLPLAWAAEFLKLPHLLELCKKFLVANLTISNCVRRFRMAVMKGYEDVQREVGRFMQEHFQEILSTNQELLEVGWREMSCLLGSDPTNISKEDTVFEALVKWVEHDRPNRIHDFPNLLSCVRMGLLSRSFFEQEVCTHPLMATSEEAQLVLFQASQLIADITSNEESAQPPFNPVHPFLRPRVPSHVLFVTGGWSTGSATNVMETFDVNTGRWFLTLCSDSVPRAYHGMVWLGGHVYLVGGFDGNKCFNSVRRFDPVNGTWEERGCMHEARCYVSVATVPPLMYAMGGYNGHQRASSCEVYHPETNQWLFVAPMHQIRSDASADSLDGKVYIAGGFNGTEVLDSAEFYDPEVNQWTMITRMLNPRSGIKLVALNNNIYVIGGFNGFNRIESVEMYNTESKIWSYVSSMLTPRSNFATAVIDNKIFAIGGFNGISTTSYVEKYDSSTDTWREVPEMNLNRSALAACTVWGIPNAKDYSFLGNVQY